MVGPFRVVSPFKHGVTLIESGEWYAPTAEIADRLLAAGCLKPLRASEAPAPIETAAPEAAPKPARKKRSRKRKPSTDSNEGS